MAGSNVVVFSETLWPDGGGAELATYLFVKHLVSQGYGVTVVSGRQMPAFCDGTKVVSDGALRAGSKTELWAKILSREDRLKGFIRDSDVVYIPRLCYPLAPVARKLGKKVLVHLHDYTPVSYSAAVPSPYERTADYPHRVKAFSIWLEGRRGRKAQSLAVFGDVHTRMARFWLAEADHIICVSNRQAQIISETAPELSHLLTRIYNPLPVRPGPLNGARRGPLFLYVGGTSYHKGYHVFIKVANQLLDRGTGVRFLLTRDTGYANDRMLSQAMRTSGAAFEVLGRVPYGELLGTYSKVRGLIFPSVWEEPLSYAVAECMAAGTIPIASNVGGNGELVKGSSAERFLFEPFDSYSLSGNIEAILSMSDDELRGIGENLTGCIHRTLSAEETTGRFVRLFGN